MNNNNKLKTNGNDFWHDWIAESFRIHAWEAELKQPLDLKPAVQFPPEKFQHREV